MQAMHQHTSCTHGLQRRSACKAAVLHRGKHSRCRAATTLDAAAATVAKPVVDVALAPHVMVNSCTGRMGHSAAESVVKAGLTLVPFTLTGFSAGVAVSNIGVAGIPVEVVGKERRQYIMRQIREQHPRLIVVDYTTPNCVNGEQQLQPAARGGQAR
eukprot:GHRQ01021473.1.p1 GENE.GHRQ01021473.1~~GHRQ01021473.1.p1  ORF type:complete len:157 (+),score=22.54 GHRQ01021473.1:256-726(+)